MKDKQGSVPAGVHDFDQWAGRRDFDKAAGCVSSANTKSDASWHFAATSTRLGTARSSNPGCNVPVSTFSLTVTGFAGGDVVNAGHVISIAGVNEVDPETKASLGRPKQFVVTATSAAGPTTLSIAPGIITGGSYQNVDSVPASGALIQIFGVSGAAASSPLANISGQLIKQSLGWYRDAIVFANPPMLDLSPLVKMTAAESFEGYNMRFAQQWDPSNDVLPARLDSIVGAVLSYPELAVRNIEVASAS